MQASDYSLLVSLSRISQRVAIALITLYRVGPVSRNLRVPRLPSRTLTIETAWDNPRLSIRTTMYHGFLGVFSTIVDIVYRVDSFY